MKFIAVLAGTYQQFREYAKTDDRRLVFCNRWPEFAGIEFDEVVQVGTFSDRPDALELYQYVLPKVRREALAKP